MKLIKLSEEHYIVVDDSEIKEGDWIYDLDTPRIVIADSLKVHTSKKEACWYYKKITRSTEPLDKSLFFTNRVWGCERLSLGEVKELLGVVDVEKKAFELAILFHNTYEKLAPAFGYETRLDTKVFDKNSANGKLMIAVCKEIYQALEDNKEKKYTEEDLMKFYKYVKTHTVTEALRHIQPKTEWEVEFVDGKLKLI